MNLSPDSNRTPTPLLRTITGAAAVAALVVLAACGSDTPATVEPIDDRPAEVDLDAVRAELDALVYESETIDGVAVLGNQPLEIADDTAGTTAEIEPEGEPGDPSSEACVDDGPCDDVSPLPPPPAPEFVPAADWAPFCTVLAELEDRPMPTDDEEMLRTIDVWFQLLEPHVPSVVRADFTLLDDVIDDAVAANDTAFLVKSSSDVDAAAERIGDAVDVECSGLR